MKYSKIAAMVFVLGFSVSCFGCSKNSISEQNSDAKDEVSTTTLISLDTTDKTESITELLTTDSEITTQNDTDSVLPTREYVESYNIYAEKGAIITKTDSQTGEFSWKAKCEFCGKEVSGVGNSYAHLTSGKLKGSFTCTNAQCSARGKNQDYVICCEVSGEWVEKN